MAQTFRGAKAKSTRPKHPNPIQSNPPSSVYQMSFLLAAVAPPCFAVIQSAASQPRRGRNSKNTQKSKQNVKTTKPSTAVTSTTNNPSGFSGKGKNPLWQCIQNCGACCKLDKGPDFPSPEEVFDDPSDIQLYKSLVGSDGWCIHYEKSTRKCSIYDERPYFCRVEPEIFETLYGIEKKKFNKEACSCCIDTIKAVYGSSSTELDTFNQAIWNTTTKSSHLASPLPLSVLTVGTED